MPCLQGTIDTAAVSSFFAECAALRYAVGLTATARSGGRRMAASAQQKPPLLHSPGLSSGPSPPPATSYASLQVRLPVPDWPVLPVYTSITSAKKRPPLLHS